MVSLFIFKSNARGMLYGIGTYIRQLTIALLNHSDANIIIVNYKSNQYKEFKIFEKNKRLLEVYIPSSILKFHTAYYEEKYAEIVVDLLSETISIFNNIIFQINYFDALQISKILRAKYSFPIVSIIHSAQWQFIFNGNKQKFIDCWINRKCDDKYILKQLEEEKALYVLSDKIISVTEYMKTFIADYYQIPEKKIIVVNNGIDSTIFKLNGKNKNTELKEKLGFNKFEKIILFVGRLDQSKGIYLLIDAFTEVIKHYKNIRLVLVGEDSGPDKICQYLTHCTNIWGKVTFTGFIEFEHILQFYQIADVGIIPSIYDHCPYVIFEMIGHNIPLIISNIDGLNEILSENQCIFITPLIDSAGNITLNKKDIVDAILTLITVEESIVNHFTADYSNLIKERFSSERMCKEMLSALSEIQKKNTEA